MLKTKQTDFQIIVIDSPGFEKIDVQLLSRNQKSPIEEYHDLSYDQTNDIIMDFIEKYRIHHDSKIINYLIDDSNEKTLVDECLIQDFLQIC